MTSETKADATKEKILQVTWKMLENQGNTVRMSDIAKQAGVSRQAVYNYYPSRAQLLIETTKYAGNYYKIDERLVPSRQAKSGTERLSAYIEAWLGFLPLVFPVLNALRAMKDSDEAAKTAYENRMTAMREGCETVVAQLKTEGKLTPALTESQAVDLFFSMLWMDHWERLVKDGSWSDADYIKHITAICAGFLTA